MWSIVVVCSSYGEGGIIIDVRQVEVVILSESRADGGVGVYMGQVKMIICE